MRIARTVNIDIQYLAHYSFITQTWVCVLDMGICQGV